MVTYLDELVRFPHTIWQAFEGDIHRWDGFASEQLLLVTAQNS